MHFGVSMFHTNGRDSNTIPIKLFGGIEDVDLLERYRDMGVARVVTTLPPERPTKPCRSSTAGPGGSAGSTRSDESLHENWEIEQGYPGQQAQGEAQSQAPPAAGPRQ